MTTGSQTLTIRPMREDDIVPLAEALSWPPGGIRARWVDSERGRREMLVAEHDGGIAGSVSLNVRKHAPGYLHLFALDVSPALRGRGIGTALVAAVEEEARRRGLRGVCLDVGVENHGARRLYERLGYVGSGEVTTLYYSVPDGTGGWRDLEELNGRMFHTFEGGT